MYKIKTSSKFAFLHLRLYDQKKYIGRQKPPCYEWAFLYDKITVFVCLLILYFSPRIYVTFTVRKKRNYGGRRMEIHTSMCLLGEHSTNNNFIHFVMKLFGKYNPEWREIYKPCQKFYLKFEDIATFHFVCIIFLTQYRVFPNILSCLILIHVL